jgi:hypothetical protein
MSSPRTPKDPTKDPTTPTDRVALLEQHLQAVADQAHLHSHVPASPQDRKRQQHHIRAHQRRRTRGRLLVGSVLGLAAATAVVTTATHDWAGTVSTTAASTATAGVSATAAPSASSTSPAGAGMPTAEAGAASCLSDVSQPSWRPAIVVSLNVVCPPAAAGSAIDTTSAPNASHVGTIIEYKLSGAANQESLSSDPDAVSPTGQAETDITFVSYPDANAIDRGDGGEGIDVSTVRLSNGFDARLSQGSNGYGAVRVAWSDGKHSYLLLTTNYKTVSGTSGPSVDDMIKMAGSVPAALDGEALLSCGGDLPSFSASALNGGIEGSSQEAELRAALDDAGVNAGLGGPRLVQGQMPPDVNPRVLASQVIDNTERLLVAVGQWNLAVGPVEGNQFYVVLNREGTTWRATGWGNCDLAPMSE